MGLLDKLRGQTDIGPKSETAEVKVEHIEADTKDEQPIETSEALDYEGVKGEMAEAGITVLPPDVDNDDNASTIEAPSVEVALGSSDAVASE